MIGEMIMRLCMVDSRLKYFHEWAMRGVELQPSVRVGGGSGGIINAPVGLVEDVITGKMSEVHPGIVQFVTVPEGHSYMSEAMASKMVDDIKSGTIGMFHEEEQCIERCADCGTVISPTSWKSDDLWLLRNQSGEEICMKCHTKYNKYTHHGNQRDFPDHDDPRD